MRRREYDFHPLFNGETLCLKEALLIFFRMAPKKKATESMDQLYLRQYEEQSAKHGEKTAILLQVGKFYEMYDSVDVSSGLPRANVTVLAEICGCAVEPQSTQPGTLRLFWGFPTTSLPKYERMLIAAGYTVVVIVQNKDSFGDVESRTIDYVSSPGTYWDHEGGLAVRREEQVMLSVYIEPCTTKPLWFLASTAFDIMTGKLTSTETEISLVDGKPVCDAIAPFWSMYPPAETVVYWCSAAPPPAGDVLADIFFLNRSPIHVHALDPSVENSVAKDRLRLALCSELFQRTALSITEQLGVGMYHFARRSLYQLLEFVRDHTPSYLSSLYAHTMWLPDDNVLLGNTALTQLAMVSSNPDKPQESLLYWLQKAHTSMGKRALRERCLKPIACIEELEARQARIEALRSADRAPIESGLKGMCDLARMSRKFQLGHGTTDALILFVNTYEKASVLETLTRGKLYGPQDGPQDEPQDGPQEPHHSGAGLASHLASLLNVWDVDRLRANKAQIETAVAVALGSVHPWKRGIHAELDACEEEWKVLETEVLALKGRMEELLQETGVITWTLKEDVPFTLVTTARRATQIEALSKKALKVEVRHEKWGTAKTAVTLTAEPIRVANEKAVRLRTQWKALVEETWKKTWQTWLAAERAGLEQLIEFVGRLDTECALASLAEKYGYVRPRYEAKEREAGFVVKDLRHPIIERILTVPYVPHSLAFGSFASSSASSAFSNTIPSTPCGMLLYGVNAAGKSSLGKAIGLAVLMAQCGMPVPASEMTIVPYTAVFTRILGNDNLWAGMSSFVVEMTEFRSILRSAGPKMLVIGDELCAGTETASATAIVAAGIQTLVSRGAHFFFATHLHELADMKLSPSVRSFHLTVRSENETLVYDRKLREGCGSPMYGLEVCRGLDMDPEFLKAAFAFRKRLTHMNTSHTSRYNATVVVDRCAVCESRSGLETHHIVHQADAVEGRISPGKHVHSAENLVVLCEECHAQHHRGTLRIQGWEQTSEGRRLSYAHEP